MIFIKDENIDLRKCAQEMADEEGCFFEFKGAKENDFLVTPKQVYIFTDYLCLSLAKAELTSLLEIPMQVPSIKMEDIYHLSGKARFVVPDTDTGTTKVFNNKLEVVGEIPGIIGLR